MKHRVDHAFPEDGLSYDERLDAALARGWDNQRRAAERMKKLWEGTGRPDKGIAYLYDKFNIGRQPPPHRTERHD